MRTGHDSSVVPIGGAPFVRPYTKILRPIDTNLASQVPYSFPSSSSSSSSSSTTTNYSSAAAMYSPPPTSSVPLPGGHFSQSTSNSSSDFSTSFSDGSGSGSSSGSGSPQFEAALRYSFALHEHTRRMWEKERFSIEKSKLEGSHSRTSSEESSAHPNAANSAKQQQEANHNRRSSLGSSFGVDSLWNRKKKHTKNSASIY